MFEVPGVEDADDAVCCAGVSMRPPADLKKDCFAEQPAAHAAATAATPAATPAAAEAARCPGMPAAGIPATASQNDSLSTFGALTVPSSASMSTHPPPMPASILRMLAARSREKVVPPFNVNSALRLT